MKRAYRILSNLVVLGIDVVAVRMWGTWFDYSQLWAQVAQRDSGEIETRVTALSQLRLRRVENATEFLEMPFENQVLMIAFGESKTLNLNPNTMTPACLKAL